MRESSPLGGPSVHYASPRWLTYNGLRLEVDEIRGPWTNSSMSKNPRLGWEVLGWIPDGLDQAELSFRLRENGKVLRLPGKDPEHSPKHMVVSQCACESFRRTVAGRERRGFRWSFWTEELPPDLAAQEEIREIAGRV